MSELSPIAQDYLKLIWSLEQDGPQRATSRMLSERLGVSPSTVSETLRRLADNGLVAHEKYGGVDLTPAGRRLAVGMVRRHRLIELFLVKVLEFDWDEVHDQADAMEHVVTDALIDRVDAFLGHPTRDPHGDPIPSADGRIDMPDLTSVASLDVGQGGAVARVSDADPALLRHLSMAGVRIDGVVTVSDRPAFAGTVVLAVEGASDPLTLSGAAAEAILVRTEESGNSRHPRTHAKKR